MRLFFVVLLSLFYVSSVQAKYEMPENVLTRADKDAIYLFSYMDKNHDGRLTLQEYKGKEMTRDVRRKIRAEKKAGTYKSPEEEFKIMDEDEDGFITREDLEKYLNSKVRDY